MPITAPPITPSAARRARRRQQRTERRLHRLLIRWQRMAADTPRRERLALMAEIGDAAGDATLARLDGERWLASHIDDCICVAAWMRWPDPDDADRSTTPTAGGQTP
ncbi:MAG: hypothetical protein OXC62_02575 [Aestuariivita sp.]|nr:hypothetical protein [Aestuariivita sp.]